MNAALQDGAEWTKAFVWQYDAVGIVVSRCNLEIIEHMFSSGAKCNRSALVAIAEILHNSAEIGLQVYERHCRSFVQSFTLPELQREIEAPYVTSAGFLFRELSERIPMNERLKLQSYQTVFAYKCNSPYDALTAELALDGMYPDRRVLKMILSDLSNEGYCRMVVKPLPR